MKSIFIIVNGSNDLYYSISKDVRDLLLDLNSVEDIEINILYKLVNIDKENIWRKVEGEYLLEEDMKSINFKNKIITEEDGSKWFKESYIENSRVFLLDIKSYLKDKLKDENENIVIITGHGGPFQSLLDMSEESQVSMNTRILCNDLSNFNIDLLYLDMCAMNYLEVIYELTISGNIKNVITYKGLAPFIGGKYIDFFKCLQKRNTIEEGIDKFLLNSNLPLIHIKGYKKDKLDKCKEILNNLAIVCAMPGEADFNPAFKLLNAVLNELVIQNKAARAITGISLVFIKYYLLNEIERIIYNKYLFSENNLFRFLVSNEEQGNEPNGIILEKESLEHIIWLHNPALTREQLNLLVDKMFLK